MSLLADLQLRRRLVLAQAVDIVPQLLDLVIRVPVPARLVGASRGISLASARRLGFRKGRRVHLGVQEQHDALLVSQTAQLDVLPLLVLQFQARQGVAQLEDPAGGGFRRSLGGRLFLFLRLGRGGGSTVGVTVRLGLGPLRPVCAVGNGLGHYLFRGVIGCFWLFIDPLLRRLRLGGSRGL